MSFDPRGLPFQLTHSMFMLTFSGSNYGSIAAAAVLDHVGIEYRQSVKPLRGDVTDILFIETTVVNEARIALSFLHGYVDFRYLVVPVLTEEERPKLLPAGSVRIPAAGELSKFFPQGGQND